MTSNPFRVVTIDIEGIMHESEWQCTADVTLLRQLQQGVGGTVDAVQLTDEITMWVNDEGLWLFGVNNTATAVARHFGFTGQYYHGPVVFTGGVDTEGSTLPLSAKAAQAVKTSGYIL